MPYTVWSHGRLIGESALDYRRVFPRHRMGDFFPTEAGEKVMPVATGVSRAGADLVKTLSGALPGSPARAHLRETSEYADLAAAEDRYEGLALELRGPDGTVIPTEWIDLRDTEFLLSISDGEDDEASDVELDFSEEAHDEFGEPPPGFTIDVPDPAQLEDGFDCSDSDEPWVHQYVFPRYQVQVMLRQDASAP